MEICSYGCGREAIKQFKNGKWCCNINQASCPSLVEKMSSILKNSKRFQDKNPAFTKKICSFCSKGISIPNFKRHVESCYLNPKNLRACPVCNSPMKFNTETCSPKCSRVFRIEMYTKIGRNNGNQENGLEPTYRTICFSNHEKKCVVCGESNVVSVHHYDENHSNNLPENLIPICLTHQVYMHSKFKDLINEKIEQYRKEWLGRRNE